VHHHHFGEIARADVLHPGGLPRRVGELVLVVLVIDLAHLEERDQAV
jgi:hypothetical protein